MAILFRKLPVKLTEDERRTKTDQLVAKIQVRDGLEEDAKGAAADFKSRIKSCDTEIDQLSREIREWKETRDVECFEAVRHDRGVMELIRRDTLDVVEHRPLTRDELQTNLFPIEGGARAAGSESA